MIFRHRKCKIITSTIVICGIWLPHIVANLAPTPLDYLVPPPLPAANEVATRFKQDSAAHSLLAESRTIPKFINPQLVANQNDKQSGIMTRVARWFGFAKQNSLADQQLTLDTNKHPYYYQKPQHHQQHIKGNKEHCYLCNKYPWVPMLQNSIQYPPAAADGNGNKHSQLQTYLQNYGNSNDGQQQQLLQNSYITAGVHPAPQLPHSASNLKQRAAKFNFPLPFIPPPSGDNSLDISNHIQYSSGPFLPIPIPPHLSNSVLPPLYNAQNFLAPISPISTTVQDLPSSEPTIFRENIAQHSEIHFDTASPTQMPPTTASKDVSFEIVKSHQLLDYISSVEYPASYVPSHSFEISTQPPHFPAEQLQTNSNINTGVYKYSTFSPNLSQHVPASEILTQPGSFVSAIHQQQSTQQTHTSEQTTTTSNNPPQFLNNLQQQYEDDSYVAASQKNSSVLDQYPEQQQHQTNLDAWTLESNDFIYATSTPELFATGLDTKTSTSELQTTTQPQIQDNEIEFMASIQTKAQHHDNKETHHLLPIKTIQRETPKHLLDSPIQHINGNLGAPRPFTRDPSDLTVRVKPLNHKMSDANQDTSAGLTIKPQTKATESAIYSSTFSSIDASGQYAGMSPPSLPSNYNSDKILLPYLTTKTRPRPFESTDINTITKPSIALPQFVWSQTPNVELHTPQESMLIRSHIKPAATITTTTLKPHTTKYLTKILASNLRELLQREHEPIKQHLSPNSLDIDINKLQKNIDDWTEQEYTSLSHRPSTPTIRGRSKHIPFEYLPTTTAPIKATRESKNTKSYTENSDLLSSINNLEPLYERGSTQHFQYTQITDNHLSDFYTNFESLKSKSATKQKISTTHATSTATTTPTRTSITTTEKSLSPKSIQIQETDELWKKAKVSISPKTQEKVYVVTPQPRFLPQRFYTPIPATSSTTTTTTTTKKPLSVLSLGSGFKSPRFLVRPAPGNDTQTKETSKERTSKSYFTPEWFGLRGLSAYVPAEPVEIIDGNSKVINIATPPSNLEKDSSHNIMDLTKDRHTAPKRKPTMTPSPR